MAWVGTAKKVAQKVGPHVVEQWPTIARHVPNVAGKVNAAKQDKKKAHTLAWQCHGKVGQVIFPEDGVTRWVIANENLKPVSSIPKFKSGSAEELAAALAGVDLKRCLTAPAQEVSAQKAERKAAAKAEKQALKKHKQAPQADTREAVNGSVSRRELPEGASHRSD